MKAALLISGYLRTFKLNIDNLKEKIVKKFKSVDVYIHITIDETSDDHYLNVHNINEDIQFIKEKINPIGFICEYNLNITPNKKENDIINNWLKYFKLNQLKKCNEQIIGKYDIVIKYRPDLYITSEKINILDISKDIIYIPEDITMDVKKLKNDSDKYICDAFAYGNSVIMDKYFDIYLKIRELLSLYGITSETLLYNYLTSYNINYNLFNLQYGMILSSCNIFAICGDSGTGKTTLAKYLKQYFSNSFLLECDRYHKWERNDDKWKIFTHLNPDANYISKIDEDVFNLKLGNSVYQVDYNHENGKFTGIEEIKPSDNIIVCGLHSLYGNNNHLYNFKIFMDIDENLKTKWKVERDIIERGYDITKISTQINRRKSDFQKFIYPQKNKSDMIIKFYTTNIKSTDLSLNLSIHKKYNLNNIIQDLDCENIKYSLINDDNFIIFSFSKYQDNKLLPISTPKLNNFYDYIIFFILNLRTISTLKG